MKFSEQPALDLTPAGEVIHDPRTSPVSTDGAMAQLAAIGHRDIDLVTPKTRTRTRTRRRLAAASEQPKYERADERDEIAVLKSTVEGLAEESARQKAELAFLRSGVQRLLQRVFPGGIPYDGDRTPA